MVEQPESAVLESVLLDALKGVVFKRDSCVMLEELENEETVKPLLRRIGFTPDEFVRRHPETFKLVEQTCGNWIVSTSVPRKKQRRSLGSDDLTDGNKAEFALVEEMKDLIRASGGAMRAQDLPSFVVRTSRGGTSTSLLQLFHRYPNLFKVEESKSEQGKDVMIRLVERSVVMQGVLAALPVAFELVQRVDGESRKNHVRPSIALSDASTITPDCRKPRFSEDSSRAESLRSLLQVSLLTDDEFSDSGVEKDEESLASYISDSPCSPPKILNTTRCAGPSGSWDFPLSREEMKWRVTQLLSMENKSLELENKRIRRALA
jgi:hypothetical protein